MNELLAIIANLGEHVHQLIVNGENGKKVLADLEQRALALTPTLDKLEKAEADLAAANKELADKQKQLGDVNAALDALKAKFQG